MIKRKAAPEGSIEHIIEVIKKLNSEEVIVNITGDQITSLEAKDLSNHIKAVTDKAYSFWDSFRVAIIHHISKGGGLILTAHKSINVINVVNEISRCVMETNRVDQMFQMRPSGAIETMRGYPTDMTILDCLLNGHVLIVNAEEDLFLTEMLLATEVLKAGLEQFRTKLENMVVFNLQHSGSDKRWITIMNNAHILKACLAIKLDIAGPEDEVDEVYEMAYAQAKHTLNENSQLIKR